MSSIRFRRRALSASTSGPNDADTDALMEVMHDVSVVVDEHGVIEDVRVMASDPVAAMDAVSHMTDEAFQQLPRINVH
ncbi:hypothetical protein [Methylibium petroleiphilum]|uniref:Uncharacterized protein n=1 Tax=Methylibium petroleiphilum (strain ATCC BAA-1232 / LMG 22953 / PM1) TaxID=420662 RepID=A2SNJ0_METPP|nr:hypothetical protein [Methylibium petroleiphilum]ABM97129.1 hypothetical protein Mpe_B0354 [Methylibium petroleiphilum PM1]